MPPEAEAEVIVRAVCATKLPTLTHEDNGWCGAVVYGVCVFVCGTCRLCATWSGRKHGTWLHLSRGKQRLINAPHRSFRALLSDLFPGVPVTDAANPELEAALRAAAAAEGLELTPLQARAHSTAAASRAAHACVADGPCACGSHKRSPHLITTPPLSLFEQVTKALQLALACDQRIGVILVGPPGAGKSTLWRLLEAALGRLGAAPAVHRRARFGDGQGGSVCMPEPGRPHTTLLGAARARLVLAAPYPAPTPCCARQAEPKGAAARATAGVPQPRHARVGRRRAHRRGARGAPGLFMASKANYLCMHAVVCWPTSLGEQASHNTPVPQCARAPRPRARPRGRAPGWCATATWIRSGSSR